MEVHGGFNGLAELLILRVLHYMLGEEPHKIEVTRDLRAFHYPKSNLVLAAGYPLQVGLRRKWLDIIVYKPKEGKPKEIEELLSVVEVKVYPQGGIRELENIFRRLEEIRDHYRCLHAMLIIYQILGERKRSKLWRFIESVESPIEVVVLKGNYEKAIKLFKPLTTTRQR